MCAPGAQYGSRRPSGCSNVSVSTPSATGVFAATRRVTWEVSGGETMDICSSSCSGWFEDVPDVPPVTTELSMVERESVCESRGGRRRGAHRPGNAPCGGLQDGDRRAGGLVVGHDDGEGGDDPAGGIAQRHADAGRVRVD